MGNLISATKAAEILGVSRTRVNQLIHDGKLRAERIGNVWAVDEDAVMHRAAEKNGKVYYDGALYTLVREAVLDDGCYIADAICSNDERDEDGMMPLYRVTWSIPDDAESADDIDWTAPDDVEQYDCIDLSVPSLEAQKWAEVQKLSAWGRYPSTYSANLGRVSALPDTMLDKLDASELAALVDAFHDCYHDGDMAGRRRNE